MASPCPLIAKLLWKAGRKKKRAATGFAWVKFATPRATCWHAARLASWRSTRNTSSASAPNEKKFRDSQIFQRRRNMQAKKPNGSGNGHGGKAKGSNEWRGKGCFGGEVDSGRMNSCTQPEDAA